MPFMSYLINYDFTLVLVQHSGFINLSFHNFILNNNSQKYYNYTWCTYEPPQLHVLYTLSGRGIIIFLHPTHINYISLYALNRDSFIGRRPKYELTAHSSTLMMDDNTHVHTPNMLMSLCICNANVTTISQVTCMMHTA